MVEITLSGLSVIISALALVFAHRSSTRSQANERAIAMQSDALSSRVADSERTLAQRQIIVAMWPYIINTPSLDGEKAEYDSIRAALNTATLIAHCVHGDAIDKRFAWVLLGELFLDLCRRIESVVQIEGATLAATGADLLGKDIVLVQIRDMFAKWSAEAADGIKKAAKAQRAVAPVAMTAGK